MDNNKKVALLIDADNINNPEDIKTIIEEINTNYGIIFIKKAYADWSKNRFDQLKTFALENAIDMVMQPQCVDTKNSTDIALVIDAMDILYIYNYVDTFCILTGDSDFLKLASRLKKAGKQVIGFGYSKSAQKYLIKACDDYKFIDIINNSQEEDNEISDNITSTEEVKNYIFTYLSSNEFSQLGGLKSSIKSKFPDFDERNYGFSKSTSFSNFLIKTFKDDFVIKDNIIKINAENEINKVQKYVLNYMKSNGKNKKFTSSEIHNAIANKYKSFRVKDYKPNMKAFLESINGVELDKDGKYYLSK